MTKLECQRRETTTDGDPKAATRMDSKLGISSTERRGRPKYKETLAVGHEVDQLKELAKGHRAGTQGRW